MDLEAGYDEIWISKTCQVQTAQQRFGSHVQEAITAFLNEPPTSSDFDEEDDDDLLPDSDSEDAWGSAIDAFDIDADPATWVISNLAFETDFSLLFESSPPEIILPPSQPPPAHREDVGFPRIARYRCNLTVLSQRYDLYFAAYQDKIYVYRPQRAPRILPSPCLILLPGRTRAAKFTSGHIEPRFAHQINNIVVGNLGDLEIVAFAYDDGDVAAYYTHTIVRHISQSAVPGLRRPLPNPKPFFHENVGLSAWGLAIHSRSRLIAVGSNKHEVVVYAFALTQSQAPPSSRGPDHSPMVWSGQTALELERHFQSRTRTWKIILPLGLLGNNIPSVAFVDDDRGYADKVAAQDITGNTWILNIWKIGAQPTFCPFVPDRISGRYKGWGVLILPDNSFKPTRSIRETLGLPARELIEGKAPLPSQAWLDSTCSLFYLKDLAVLPKHVLNIRGRASGQDYIKKHEEENISKLSRAADTSSNDSDESLSPDSHDEYWSETRRVRNIKRAQIETRLTAEHPSSADDTLRWAAITTGKGVEGSALDDLSNDVQLRRTILPLFAETPPPRENEAPGLFFVKDRKKRVQPDPLA